MDKTTRTYKLHRLLHGRRTAVSLQSIMDELECSRATANRVIREMRDEFAAPIEFDRERGGYFYGKSDGRQFDLPGVWFSEAEMLALLTMEQLLSQMGNTYLSRLLAPARERVVSMLSTADSTLSTRIRVIEHMQRRTRCEAFEPVLAGLVQRRRLLITYHTRTRDTREERTISPQRMTHFRSNWYLDAWCHTRNDLRRFALDAIEAAAVLDDPAHEVPMTTLAERLDRDYGAFVGTPDKEAVLIFSAKDARWVADELWHSQQTGRWLENGTYELRMPYTNDRELIMDILRCADGVEVIAPPSLREAVRLTLQKALAQYT